MSKARGKHERKLAKRVNYARYGYIFSLPFVLAFLVFQLYPLIFTTVIGFTDVQGNMTGLSDATFAWNTVVDGGSELMIWSNIEPVDATNTAIEWELIPGTGNASLEVRDNDAVITALANGSITVRASSMDGSDFFEEIDLNIVGHIEPVRSVSLYENPVTITSLGGSLRLNAKIEPENATTQTLFWEIIPGTGKAFINQTGRVEAVADGTVTVRATTVDGSDIVEEHVITISGQQPNGFQTFIPVEEIEIVTMSGETTIEENGGTLQMMMVAYPFDAGRYGGSTVEESFERYTPPRARWSVVNGTGSARIASDGTLTALTNGTVFVRAVSDDIDGSLTDIFGELEIQITGQENDSVPMTSLNLSTPDNRTVISIEGYTLTPFYYFAEVFNSPLFRKALGNTIFMWILNFIPQIILSLALAAWFTNSMMRLKGVGFFKVMFYMPNIITAGSIAMLFSLLFGHPIGPVNGVLMALGINDQPVNFLIGTFAEPFGFRIFNSQLIIAFIQFWMWYGVTMILLIAGIMGISPSLFESAAIDGASNFKTFVHVTLPSLRTVIVYVLVTSFVGGMQMFDIPRLFDNGRPQNATLTSSLFIYQQAFEGARRYNRAAAASLIMFFIICAVSGLLFYLMRDRDAARLRREYRARERARGAS